MQKLGTSAVRPHYLRISKSARSPENQRSLKRLLPRWLPRAAPICASVNDGEKNAIHNLQFGAAMNARRAQAKLESLPDYLLKDIGISRGEIGYYVRRGPKDVQ